jgi:hypothetical protein
MYRKTLHQLLILLMVLGLAGTGASMAPRVARADSSPTGDPSPDSPPDTGIGDPDAPGNGRNMPRPGLGRGGSNQQRGIAVSGSRTVGFEGWMMRFRSVAALWARAFFRF